MGTSTSIPHKMMATDLFSQWLGIEIIALAPGSCELSMTIRDEMTNGFKVSHGGIVFSLADSAVAFAANGYGNVAMSVDNHIHYAKPIFDGDELTAKATERSRNKKIGHYDVTVTNQENERVAFFSGTVYFTSREHS